MEGMELVYMPPSSQVWMLDSGPAVTGCCASILRCYFACCSAACSVTEKLTGSVAGLWTPHCQVGTLVDCTLLCVVHADRMALIVAQECPCCSV